MQPIEHLAISFAELETYKKQLKVGMSQTLNKLIIESICVPHFSTSIKSVLHKYRLGFELIEIQGHNSSRYHVPSSHQGLFLSNLQVTQK